MGLFRSFSFSHRRTKSDSDVVPGVTKNLNDDQAFSCYFPLSISVRSFQYGRPLSPIYEVLDSDSSPELARQPTPTFEDFSALQCQLSHLQTDLQYADATNVQWQIDVAELRIRLDHSISLLTEAERRISEVLTDLDEKQRQCEKLQSKLSNFDALTKYLSAPGLAKDLLVIALDNIADPHVIEDEIFDFIRKKTQNASSRWSKLLPPIIGPRTQEQYVSVVNMTVKARRDARNWRKMANFWKSTARSTTSNQSVVTPSPSDISEIREPLPSSRQSAVEALLNRLRRTETIKKTDSSKMDASSFSSSSHGSLLRFTNVKEGFYNLENRPIEDIIRPSEKLLLVQPISSAEDGVQYSRSHMHPQEKLEVNSSNANGNVSALPDISLDSCDYFSTNRSQNRASSIIISNVHHAASHSVGPSGSSSSIRVDAGERKASQIIPRSVTPPRNTQETSISSPYASDGFSTPPSKSKLPTLKGLGKLSVGSPPETPSPHRQALSLAAERKLEQKRFAAATHSSSQKTISKATGKTTATVMRSNKDYKAINGSSDPLSKEPQMQSIAVRRQKVTNKIKANEGPAMIVMVGGKTLKTARVDKT